MKYLQMLLATALLLLGYNYQVYAGAEDDPLLAKFMFDQFEYRSGDGDDPIVLDGQYWLGYDLEKLWLKTEVEYVDGETEEAELQALYSKPFAPYWDFQVGVRRDIELDSSPGRNWAVIGVQGLAPYFFEVDTALFIGEEGSSSLRVEAEYELLITQLLILTPEIEANFYGQNNDLTRNGSGLSDIELGLRLRYELNRKFSPYIGLNWSKKFGNSADYSRLDGLESSETRLVFGVRTWF